MNGSQKFLLFEKEKRKKRREGMKKKVTYIGFNRQATEFTVGTTSGFYVYNEKSSDPTFRRGTYLTPLILKGIGL